MDMESMFSLILKQINLFHDLRHTFGSRLVRSGGNINLVKELMEHASIVTTQRYLHSMNDEKKRVLEALVTNPTKHDSMWQTNNKYFQGDIVSHSNVVS